MFYLICNRYDTEGNTELDSTLYGPFESVEQADNYATLLMQDDESIVICRVMSPQVPDLRLLIC